MTKPYNQECPIARTLDIVGDRWTMLVIRDLFLGKTRFTQFLTSSPGLPPKILSDRLKNLHEHGLIDRVIYSHHPLRAEYHLTDDGRSLAPVLEAMVRWGLEHCFEGEPATRDEVAGRIFQRVPPAVG